MYNAGGLDSLPAATAAICQIGGRIIPAQRVVFLADELP